MNPHTGEIKEFDSEEEAKKANFTKQLTHEQFNMLSLMNCKQRREWAKKQAKIEKRKNIKK